MADNQNHSYSAIKTGLVSHKEKEKWEYGFTTLPGGNTTLLLKRKKKKKNALIHLTNVRNRIIFNAIQFIKIIPIHDLYSSTLISTPHGRPGRPLE